LPETKLSKVDWCCAKGVGMMSDEEEYCMRNDVGKSLSKKKEG